MRRDEDEKLFDLPVTRLPEPDAVWSAIRGELDERKRRSMAARPVPGWVAAAAAVMALLVGTVGGSIWHFRAPTVWSVSTLSGSPAIAGAGRATPGGLEAGAWLETDSASSARLHVGRIGAADVGPATRLRREPAGLMRHSLSLERGSISAVIEAPPRLFLVRSPSALATDLGCAYTLDVDDAGTSRLHVTEGWVELKEHGRVSLVPAGMVAVTKMGEPPGTPYTSELGEDAREALARLDAGRGSDEDLRLVIDSLRGRATSGAERQRSATTLWHLLPRVEPDRRALVYERLAELSPPPRRVTREGILALERRMLERWRSDLHPMWSEEAQPLPTRIARRLWDLTVR
jgi:hypothetical protein